MRDGPPWAKDPALGAGSFATANRLGVFVLAASMEIFRSPSLRTGVFDGVPDPPLVR